MRFDYEQARTELQDAARRRDVAPLPSSHPWIVRLSHFCSRAEQGAKTHIAMLGTAILAYAADPETDLSRLKIAPNSPGSYHARRLADSVMARVAPLLRIDLGAKGANPLNNSPYRGPKTLLEARQQVKPSVWPLFDEMLGIIDDLRGLTTEEAREVLQAYVQVRTKSQDEVNILRQTGGRVPLSELIRGVSGFVSTRSEGGKRAQAVAAGILDALYGETNVVVGKVNDPSLDYPGDVRVMRAGRLAWSLEVRDKSMNLTEFLRFLENMGTKGYQRAAMLAVSTKQEELSIETLERRAEEFGVTLRVFTGWRTLIEEIVFHSSLELPATIDRIIDRVLVRCTELEVSPVGRGQWQDIVLAIQGHSL